MNVLDWYEKKYNQPTFPFFNRPVLTLETSLNTGKYPWSIEDATEILDDYFEIFNVDRKNFSFDKYWPNEEIFMPLNIFRKKEHKWHWIEPEPLTINMLVESACAGYWLYD